MNRFLLAAAAAALTLGAALFAALPSAQAQPAVCLNLEPGSHELSVPSQEREGNVIFRVEVGEGGVVTEFVEPGGQSIGAAALLTIFSGEDYALPEGVEIIECAGGEAAGGAMSDNICINLELGAHEVNINAGGTVYQVTLNVADGHVFTSAEVLGNSYPAAEALQLLESFGASLPEGVEIVPCAADVASAGYPNSGTGGLADITYNGASGDASNTQNVICINLEPGAHEVNINAGGTVYQVTLNVADGHVFTSAEVLGNSYPAAEALQLLESFGASLPEGVEIVPCAADAAGASYPNSGTGGLAADRDALNIWTAAGVSAAAALLAAAAAAAVVRRRALTQRG